MAAQRQADERTEETEGVGRAVKRRGILAAAGAAVAGIVAKQTSQPVAADGMVWQFPYYGMTSTGIGNAAFSVYNLGAGPAIEGTSQGDLAAIFGSGKNTGVQGQGDTGVAANGISLGVNAAGSQIGVRGETNGDTQSKGIYGKASGGVGVYGESGAGTGIVGLSTSGGGVSGASTGGNGVSGEGTTGCYGNGTTYGLYGQGLGIGIAGVGLNPTSIGGVFTGPLAPLKLTPALSGTGAPTTGTHTAGELYVDSAGGLFFCKTSGAPGAWVALGASGGAGAVNALTTLPSPERFVDTRSALGGVQGPIPATTTHTFPMTGRAGQSGNTALIIPDSATTIIGNLTVVGAAGIPLGSYITLWPGGTQPTVSNINYGPAGTLGAIANSYVVGLTNVGGHGTVSVYNLSACDYILDVTGYYTSAASGARPKA